MPLIALACTLLVAILIKLKNFVIEVYENIKGVPLSPPTETDSLFGLLFACFYYLYLQVWRLLLVDKLFIFPHLVH